MKKPTTIKKAIVQMSPALYNELNERANQIGISISTYIRALIHLDVRFKFFDVIRDNLTIDTDTIKYIDKKMLVSGKGGAE